MDDPIPQRYRRLLVGYPARWREDNGDVVLGTLLDEHAATGRSAPTARERWEFLVAGLLVRLGVHGGVRLRSVPILDPDHRFDQTNGMVDEREPSADELVHMNEAADRDQDLNRVTAVAMVGLNALAR